MADGFILAVQALSGHGFWTAIVRALSRRIGRMAGLAAGWVSIPVPGVRFTARISLAVAIRAFIGVGLQAGVDAGEGHAQNQKPKAWRWRYYLLCAEK
jgi:hypothetical protein